MIVPVDIVNTALRHVGSSPIVSFNDASPQAINANLAWPLVLNEFLASHNWTFATRWADLLLLPTKSVWGYQYCHQLPFGFERLIEVKDFKAGDEFEIANVNNIVALACNTTPISIKYITNDISLSNMSSTAIMALTMRLAAHLDQMINAGVNLQNFMTLAEDARSKAILYEGTAHNNMTINKGFLNEARNG